MSNIEEYTKNFKFMIPEFNVATWHTEIKENFKAIDVLIANFVQAQQYKGAWKQVTSYVVDDLVYISDEDSTYYGSLMRIMVDHITTGDDFDTFLAAHPEYYVIQGEMGAQIAALRAQDWAEKTDGMVTVNEVPIDYSSKAYAIGGTGTETNNSKYFKEQAELARDGILQDPGFIAVKNDLLGDENIKTVADNIQNVNSIGNNILNILSVYNNLSDINTCSSNMAAILDAPTQATNASNYAASSKQWAIGEPTEPPGGSAKYWAGQASSPVSADNKSINKNTQDEIQTIGVINQNDTSTAIKTWTGTKEEYDAIEKENWYGWEVDNTTYYTKSATPSIGDTVYDSNREAIAYTVSAVGDGYIEWEEITYRTITATYGSVDGNLYINGEELPIPTGYPSTYTWDNIPVGSTVTFEWSVETGGDHLVIRESSNETYIPNTSYMGYYPSVSYSFTMPDEDITFSISWYD